MLEKKAKKKKKKHEMRCLLGRVWHSARTPVELWREGRPEEGLRLARQHLASSPRDPLLLLELADMELGAGSVSEAARLAEAALAAGAKRSSALFLRGAARELLGDAEGAEADLRECLREEEGHSGAARRLASMTGSPEVLSRAVAREEERRERAVLLYERGRLLLARRRAEEAMRDFEAALEADEECAVAHFGKADVLALGGEFGGALHHYDRFWELHGRFYGRRPELNSSSFSDASLVELCVKRAACYAGLNMWQMVAKCAETALQVGETTGTPAAHWYRGKAHEAENEMERAKEQFEMADKVQRRLERLAHAKS